jgi:hypothetical protein
MARFQAAAAALLAIFLSSEAMAVDKGKAKYVGGTVPGLKEKEDGAIDLKGEERLTYLQESAPIVEILWAKVEDVEYGQKAGRRVKTAIFLSPLALFGKSRKHYVTFSFKDEKDIDQAAVFEFDKDEIRMALAVIKARTGKEITMQDEEAKKQMGGGTEKKQ